jgi:hypothetical protein
MPRTELARDRTHELIIYFGNSTPTFLSSPAIGRLPSRGYAKEPVPYLAAIFCMIALTFTTARS